MNSKTSIEPEIKTVTVENWSTYFHNEPLSPETKQHLENDELYFRVALDPQTRQVAGKLEVYYIADNGFAVNVYPEFQRRGIATALIKQAQADHDYLQLVNFAEEKGLSLYTKLGFTPIPDQPDYLEWRKK